MHPNHPEVSGMLYFFALNKSKIIQFYYSSPIIEIGIIILILKKAVSIEKQPLVFFYD